MDDLHEGRGHSVSVLHSSYVGNEPRATNEDGLSSQSSLGCMKLFKARIEHISFTLSIPCFSIILSVMPVIITALSIVLAMSSLYSNSIDEFAKNSANALSSQAAANVVALLQAPYSIIDELQYIFRMGNMQLPTEQMAETARALQGLETLAATNVSDPVIVPLRNVINAQSSTTDKIKSSFFGAMRQSGDKCPNVMLAWKDGTFMSSGCSSNGHSYNFASMFPNASISSGLMPTITYDVDRATGRNITTTQQSLPAFSDSSIDWFSQHTIPMRKVWSAMTIVRNSPVVSLTGALFNTVLPLI